MGDVHIVLEERTRPEIDRNTPEDQEARQRIQELLGFFEQMTTVYDEFCGLKEGWCSMRIVIAGGSGQVGQILARHFAGKGDNVTVLSRRPQTTPWRVVLWDGVSRGDWVAELEQSDVCINLSGRIVNCRYGKRNRREILDSRIQSTLLLNDVIRSLKHPPQVWLNASTATIYRHSLDRDMDETTGELGGNEAGAPDTWNFSIEVAKSWEKAFFASRPTPGTRLVALRSAMTMSPDRGGVFDVLLGLVRHGLGGEQGLGDAIYVLDS